MIGRRANRIPLTIAVALGALLASGFGTTVDAATTPNYSIFFFKDGTLVFGTVRGGLFSQKSTKPTTKHWDLAAVSRTTLLMYNKTTGRYQAGTFRDGVYRKVSTGDLPPGEDLATASCNTLMLYDQTSHYAMTATLVGGRVGTARHFGEISSTDPFNSIAASCNTVSLLEFYPSAGASGAAMHSGTLKNGLFTPTTNSWPNRFVYGAMVGATATSVLEYEEFDAPNVSADWGTAKGGIPVRTSGASGLSTWDMVAGTADSLLFYQSGGVEARAVLVNGAYSYIGSTSSFSPGWTIIAGGK